MEFAIHLSKPVAFESNSYLAIIYVNICQNKNDFQSVYLHLHGGNVFSANFNGHRITKRAILFVFNTRTAVWLQKGRQVSAVVSEIGNCRKLSPHSLVQLNVILLPLLVERFFAAGIVVHLEEIVQDGPSAGVPVPVPGDVVLAVEPLEGRGQVVVAVGDGRPVRVFLDFVLDARVLALGDRQVVSGGLLAPLAHVGVVNYEHLTNKQNMNIYRYMCVCVCLRVCVCVYMYIYIYIYMCVCVCIYMCVYIYIYTHTHTHTYIYIYIKFI